jgi:hypothetical protein
MKPENRPTDEEEWYLLQELQSLGVETNEVSNLDKQELRNLVENIKQTLFQEYKAQYSQQHH